jgi:Lipocalin-like domain
MKSVMQGGAVATGDRQERRSNLQTDADILASVKRGMPPRDCPVLGTWKLQSYVRERLSDGHRHNQFGESPDGYIGYASDGRMYAIFTRHDRVAPRDVVPTDEEGVQLLGTMVAYAGTFSLGENVVVHHIDTSWNQAWTGTDQIRHFVLEGDTLTITTAPYKSYLDGTMGRSILVWTRVR